MKVRRHSNSQTTVETLAVHAADCRCEPLWEQAKLDSPHPVSERFLNILCGCFPAQLASVNNKSDDGSGTRRASPWISARI
jgi:hypothetical protein